MRSFLDFGIETENLMKLILKADCRERKNTQELVKISEVLEFLNFFEKF